MQGAALPFPQGSGREPLHSGSKVQPSPPAFPPSHQLNSYKSRKQQVLSTALFERLQLASVSPPPKSKPNPGSSHTLGWWCGRGSCMVHCLVNGNGRLRAYKEKLQQSRKELVLRTTKRPCP